MKIALIADIHGNLAALDAVLQHAESLQVETFWNAGDLTGYGSEPDQVVRRLREVEAVSVLGDFDRRVLKFEKKKDQWRTNKRPEFFLAIQWTHENLSEVSKKYLETISRDLRFGFGKWEILLFHGSPQSIKESISPGTSDKKLSKFASAADADVLISGATHQPFFRKVKKSLFMNPGSVGLPDDGDPRASYAVLDIDPDYLQLDQKGDLKVDLQHYRVAYDVDGSAEKLREKGLPEAFAQMMLQGQNLEQVMKRPESWKIPGPEDESWWISTFKSLQIRQEEEDQQLDEVIQIAEKYHCNLDHVQQATHLALRLFDELQVLHRLGPDERYWLRCASLLHDIGKPQGNKGHHKAALEMILNDDQMPFGERERQVIGLIARYHRNAWPKEKHDQFVTLPAVLQRKVTILSSILRVADGLDSPRKGNVVDLKACFSPEDITITCQVRNQAKKERKRALGKGELMEFAFDRDLYIEWHRV